MSGPISVLLSMWLLVIGYGLIFIGYEYFANGHKVSFQDAFFPKGLFAPGTTSASGPISNAIGGVQNTTAGRGGSGFGSGGGAGQGVGGGGGGSF